MRTINYFEKELSIEEYPKGAKLKDTNVISEV